MTTMTADTCVRSATASILALGWPTDDREDLGLIEAQVSTYVAGADREGFKPSDMLQDVLDKFRPFFACTGDVDVYEQPTGRRYIFFVRARRGR